jgi:formate dehydrogenase maturation protein FdhE
VKPIETKRLCKKCNTFYDIEMFPVNNTFPDRVLRKHTCKKCRSHQAKVRRKLHKENKRPRTITCPICGTHTDKPVLDHNHTTDKFRGWVCNDCNNALGKFKDDVYTLKKAIRYLQINNGGS